MRPGFVLEVDRSTPPTLFMHGNGFRLEGLPVGSRIVYPPEPLPVVADIDGAIRDALLHPVDSDPLPTLLFPGMRLTIAFDDISLPLPPCAGPTCANGSSRPCSTWPPKPAWTTSTSSPPWPCTDA